MATGLLESIDRSTQLAGYNRLALLLFRLDRRQIFGINVFKVQEVIRRPPLTRMPGAHPLVAGLAEIRGRVIPVIDLRLAIGGTAQGEGGHVIVSEYNRSLQGFLVDGVERIIHVDVQTMHPPPGTSGGDGYLTAVTRHGEELVAVIDVEKVLAEVVGEPPALSEDLCETAAQLLPERRRVLIVDDSRVARGQIERVLNQLGLECAMAPDGREALRWLQTQASRGLPLAEQLLMVISDVEMPDMDGYTLTTEIRRDPLLKGLYVLLHSSLSGVFNQAMVQKVGADRFIAKFSADELANGVLDRLRSVQQEQAA